MSDTIDTALLDAGWPAILYGFCETLTVAVLYTIYVGLFIFSVHSIVHRNFTGRRVMLIMSSGMFLLATCSMLISVLTTTISIYLIKARFQGDDVGTERLSGLYDNLGYAYDVHLTTNNLLTDLLWLYRCYVIWRSRAVLILPGILIVTTFVIAYLNVITDIIFDNPITDSRTPYFMGGATNVVLMCLTAGRIWYVSRQARHVNGKIFRRRYHTAIAMILESGALYCSILLLRLIAVSVVADSAAMIVFSAVTSGLIVQMINIIPTLIFVRVGMGYYQWVPESATVNVRTPRVPTSRLKEHSGVIRIE
ncbi:hypothetical protein K438DRAFT_1971832 [Mycena galopus ATCC 62051]|nr:hypothetical protein K438DRAFT_1971832 [Mycena galopus ATCC 62051]